MTNGSVPHSHYLERCYHLARLAGRDVGTNPNVGAVLVHKQRIIGEGYHKKYGEAHAEVNALASVKAEDQKYVKEATLYVSLEPCCIHSKTPPCTKAILAAGIKEVHVGAVDPFEGIAGRGIALLREHGVTVTVYEAADAKYLIAPFVTFHKKQRPHITLKWAKSKYNYLGLPDVQVWLTNDFTNVHTHQLRARMDAILIGTNTAILDNPTLTTRHVQGNSPLRLVLDLQHRIPLTHRLLSDQLATVIFASSSRDLPPEKEIMPVKEKELLLPTILDYCHNKGIVNLLVEGGATLHKSLIKADLWDEAMVISTEHELAEGIKAPNVHGKLVDSKQIASDKIDLIKKS